MAFNVPQLTQASFLQKYQMLQNIFFDICNAEIRVFKVDYFILPLYLFGAKIEIMSGKYPYAFFLLLVLKRINEFERKTGNKKTQKT